MSAELPPDVRDCAVQAAIEAMLASGQGRRTDLKKDTP